MEQGRSTEKGHPTEQGRSTERGRSMEQGRSTEKGHSTEQGRSGQIHVQVMGEVQIEVLKRLLAERFGMEVELTDGHIA